MEGGGLQARPTSRRGLCVPPLQPLRPAPAAPVTAPADPLPLLRCLCPCPSLQLRYANNSNYKNDTMIRKEAFVSQAVLDELKRIIEDSEVRGGGVLPCCGASPTAGASPSVLDCCFGRYIPVSRQHVQVKVAKGQQPASPQQPFLSVLMPPPIPRPPLPLLLLLLTRLPYLAIAPCCHR